MVSDTFGVTGEVTKIYDDKQVELRITESAHTYILIGRRYVHSIKDLTKIFDDDEIPL